MDSTVLVVGASGFVGSHCMHALRCAGYSVYGTYRSRSQAGNQWLFLDIFDYDAVAALISTLKPAYLIDSAWFVEHGVFWDADLNRAYVDATENLYRLFSEHGGKRAIFLGTGAEILKAEVALGADTAYAQAKRETAALLAKIRENEQGSSYLWARLYGLYGAGESEKRFVSHLIRSYLKRRPPVIQNPRLSYNFTYAPNLAHILVDQLTEGFEGAAACVTDDTISLFDMASYIHRSFFQDCPAPILASTDDREKVFSPAVDDKRVRTEHLAFLSMHDSLEDYIACIKGSFHGM